MAVWGRIAPADARQDEVANDDVPVERRSLPLAERGTTRTAKHPRRNRIGRDIVARRVAGLESMDTRSSVGDDVPRMLDHDRREAALGDCRAREVPHAPLPRADRVGPWLHVPRSSTRACWKLRTEAEEERIETLQLCPQPRPTRRQAERLQ